MMLSVCVGTAYALFMVFWTIPSVWLEGRGAASGIALISSMGQFGGLLGPWSVGKLSDMTGSLNTGLSMAAILIGIGTLLATFAIPHRRLRAAGTD
jgi:MFS transporter, ACS family, tartrate transporter